MKKLLVDLTPMKEGGVNGGAKIFIIDLLNHILPKINFKIDLIINESFNEKHLFMNYCNVIRYNQLKKKKFFIISKIFFFLKDYELIFAPFGDTHYDNRAKKSLYIFYDLQHLYYPQFFHKNELAIRKKRFKKITQNKDIKLISISNYSKYDFKKNFGNTNEIVSVPITFDPNKYKKNFLLDENKYKLIKKKYFIYPANLWKHKNHEMLILSFKMFLEKNKTSNFKLILTGSSVERKLELEEYVAKLNLTDDVIFTEYLKEDEILSLIKNCYSVIYPTLFEGFGIPIYESIILKVPVICSNLEVFKELLGEGEFYFEEKKPKEIFSKMDALYNNKSFYYELVNCIEKRSSLINDHQVMSQKYIDVINDYAY